MKRITIIIAAVFIALLSLAAPASADHNNGHKPEVSGKDVTICHYAGSNNNGGSGKYTKITVDLQGFLNGHDDHTNDIWAAFSYLERTGTDSWVTVNVPAQGDTSRLAFDKCKAPTDDEQVTKPTPSYTDECGTKKDKDLSVPKGRGYTVGDPVIVGATQTITVTLEEDFVWVGGTTEPLVFSHTFTDVSCDLPDTGMGAEFNTTGGFMALGALAMGGVVFITAGRRRKVTA